MRVEAVIVGSSWAFTRSAAFSSGGGSLYMQELQGYEWTQGPL